MVTVEQHEGEPVQEEFEELTGNSISEATSYNIRIERHEGEFNPNQVKFLAYGESGVGKTVFASSWPGAVFLDIDKGMASVSRKVYRIPISTWDQLEQAERFLAHEEHPFKTVVVDSLNELQWLKMRTLLKDFPKIRRAYVDLPSQSDYGKMLDDYEVMVRKLKALSMNIVYICNVSSQQYETDLVQPQLVGKNSARNLARMMDIIGYLYKVESGGEDEERKSRIMVFDAVQYVTKDRSDVLPELLTNPTYAGLYEHWKERIQDKET